MKSRRCDAQKELCRRSSSENLDSDECWKVVIAESRQSFGCLRRVAWVYAEVFVMVVVAGVSVVARSQQSLSDLPLIKARRGSCDGRAHQIVRKLTGCCCRE